MASTEHDDPLWFKDAVIYELHVRAFQDSNGDGIGDFRGLTERLDYLQDLGVTALWLLPFYPSPLRDDGYDIADYESVHPNYGNLKDFKRFVDEAHKRDLKVITELVINHTSDQHPWFQRALKAPAGSPERDFYVWSDDPDKYEETRIIFQDFEHSNWAWSHEAQQYYWHRFYSHQPDLNFDNPAVHRAVESVLDHWAEMGVDGMRLDAIPYLYEREGTNCENLSETHDYLKELRAHLDKKWPNRMFLAEANQWPEDAAAYFGDGDECHMNFHFPLMPRLFMAVRMEDRFPLIDILDQTPEIPDNSQWAVFLRNHDELTLEMVTDEERDYMRRVYARDPRMRINLGIRRRLAPLLDNDRRLIELMNALLFSMPGTPVLYYGDEIGMGDNIYLGDRNGVRTPMQWSPDRNAGFSDANPQSLYLPVIIDPEYHFETVNVEAQQNNTSSLLWWMKRLIAMRKRTQVFGRGSIEFLYPENSKVLAFVREYRPEGAPEEETERVLVVANLSRIPQAVELDLSRFHGRTPVEMFGKTPFPAIGELPYFLTLGAYGFYWFSLEERPTERVQVLPPTRGAEAPEEIALPTLSTAGNWHRLVTTRNSAFEKLLPDLLPTRRWFAGKARNIRHVSIRDHVEMPVPDEPSCHLLLLDVEYTQGEDEVYVLPLAFAEEPNDERVLRDIPGSVLARIKGTRGASSGVLFDAMWNRDFTASLLDLIGRKRERDMAHGTLTPTVSKGFKARRGAEPLEGVALSAEQSNTSVIYGDRFIMKLVRRPDEGPNPDLEVTRFLTDEAGYEHVPPVAGALEYHRTKTGPARTIAILQEYVPNEGDAWSYTLDALGRYLESALIEDKAVVRPRGSAREIGDRGPTETAYDRIGPYLSSAELLGSRVAELHVALSSDTAREEFAPEAFTSLYSRSVYQSVRTRSRRTIQMLRKQVGDLPDDLADDVKRLVAGEDALLAHAKELTSGKLTGLRTRTHGDLHLGQVLWTGRDYVIIDFEGEPAAPLGERRLKRSPLRDVAGMLRSFDYAAHAGVLEQIEQGHANRPETRDKLDKAATAWQEWVGGAFMTGYLRTAREGAFLPETDEEIDRLLELYLLEKSMYEIAYEMNNRPTWLPLPLAGVLQILDRIE